MHVKLEKVVGRLLGCFSENFLTISECGFRRFRLTSIPRLRPVKWFESRSEYFQRVVFESETASAIELHLG